MTNRINLILVFTVFFSFIAMQGVCAQCGVSIFPEDVLVAAGGTVQFSATAIGGGCNEPIYVWSLSTEDSTVGKCGGTIDRTTGLYTAPDNIEGISCTETVVVKDKANGNIIDLTSVTWTSDCGKDPVVTITPLLQCEGEFCAETTICDEPGEGTYTWTVTNGTADTTTGDCITVTPLEEAGELIIEVTDTTNGGMDSVTIFCDDLPFIEAVITAGCGTVLAPSVALVNIQGLAIDFNTFTRVRYELPVIPLAKLVNRNTQTINQLVLLLPGLFAGGYPATAGVTITEFRGESYSDTIIVPACGE